MSDAAEVEHRTAFATHVGRTHQKNQDAGGAWTWQLAGDRQVSLIVVADGVSSGRESEVASRMVVEILRSRVQTVLEDSSKSLEELIAIMRDAAEFASLEIAKRPYRSGPSADATTIVAALCIGREGGGVWCGDSRVFAVGTGDLHRLTRDHSWIEDVVAQGLLPLEVAARDPRAHMITRWLGPQEGAAGVETFRFTLPVGGIVLCCSDGLYGYFSPPAYRESDLGEELTRGHDDLQARVNRLVETALNRGGHDDITVAAVQVVARRA